MPFNMNTFSKMWGIRTPEEAKTIIEEQRKAVPGEAEKSGRAGDLSGWNRYL